MYVHIRHEWNFNCLQWTKHSLLTYLGPIASTFGYIITYLYYMLSRLIYWEFIIYSWGVVAQNSGFFNTFKSWFFILNKQFINGFVHIYIAKISSNFYAADRREGGNKHCFCPSICLSVCPSVSYIANNSRTQRPSVPKFGRKVPHLRCDSHTSFKVKRSKVRVGGGRGHTMSAEPGGHTACSVELWVWLHYKLLTPSSQR